MLNEVIANGGTCEIRQENDKIRAVFVATSSQKSNIEQHKPKLFQLDTTFGTNRQKYKLAVFVYPCRQSNKTRVAAFALLADERQENIEFMLRQFHALFPIDLLPKFFFVDKDFTQMAAIKAIFPGSQVYLCIFHTLKYLQGLIATMNDNVLDLQEHKSVAFGLVKEMIMSYDQAAFDEALKKWNKLVEHATVKIAGKLHLLKRYFETNWADCQDLWCTRFRRHEPVLFTNTTNRVESLFRALKLEMQNAGLKNPTLAQFIPFLLAYLERREFSHGMVVKRFSPNNSNYPEVMEEASKKLTW